MTRHTPGPFTAEEHGNRSADGSQPWAVFAPQRGEYAEPGEQVMLAEYLKREDAALFAAAPDLLASLESIVEDLRLHAHGQPAPGHREHLRLAHAAIAKAKQ